MIRLMRDFRVLPVVIVATATLFALKLTGLLLDGGYTIAHPRAANAQTAVPMTQRERQRSWAQDMLGYPDITGSVEPTKTPDKTPPDKTPPDKTATPPGGEGAKPATNEPQKPVDPPKTTDGTPVPVDGRPLTPAERAILERLQARRQELEARARELDLRENLIKAAEKRLEARVGELKDAEARLNEAMNHKDEAEQARFKGIVTMYENMKPKDAAKIFDRLDIKVLLDVASQIKPQKMSDILAQMSAETAERLTVELARLAKGPGKQPTVADLPKIEGRSPVP
jgi:flagellar motility protein MotE (MotC chaperone)